MKKLTIKHRLAGEAFSTASTRRHVTGIGSIKRPLAAMALFISLSLAQPDVLTAATLSLENPGMEQGDGTPAAWVKGPAVAGVEHGWDRTTAHSGRASICLKKTAQRYFPIAQWSQSLTVEPVNSARKLRVRCWVKAQNVTKAIVDVTYQAGQPGHVWAVYLGQKKDSDPPATHDWKLYEATVQVPAQTSKVGVALQIYGPGTVWFDDIEATWTE